MAGILLDPAIRFWVFLPIVLINFFIGIVRHYFTVLMSNDKKPDLQTVSDGQVLARSRLLRENGKCLPKTAFYMRKHYFNDESKGYFKTQKRENKGNNMFDQGIMTDMMKGQMMNVLPMMVIGTWINYAFSGFLTTQVPFPLTFRFKPLLQRGMESLVSLEPSWVSSASWYFLNFFGLRSMYSLLLGSDNQADQARAMQDAFVGGMGGGQQGAPPDTEKLFKAEWEALELVHHTFALANVEDDLIAAASQNDLSKNESARLLATPAAADTRSQLVNGSSSKNVPNSAGLVNRKQRKL